MHGLYPPLHNPGRDPAPAPKVLTAAWALLFTLVVIAASCVVGPLWLIVIWNLAVSTPKLMGAHRKELNMPLVEDLKKLTPFAIRQILQKVVDSSMPLGRLFRLTDDAQKLHLAFEEKRQRRINHMIQLRESERDAKHRGEWHILPLILGVLTPLVTVLTFVLVAVAMQQSLDSQHDVEEQLLCQSMHANSMRLNRLLSQNGTLKDMSYSGSADRHTWLKAASKDIFQSTGNPIAEMMASFSVLANQGLYSPVSMFAVWPDGTVLSTELFSSGSNNRTEQGIEKTAGTRYFATLLEPSSGNCSYIPHIPEAPIAWQQTTAILGTKCIEQNITHVNRSWWFKAAKSNAAPTELSATNGPLSNGRLGVTYMRTDSNGVTYGLEIDMLSGSMLMKAPPTGVNYVLQQNGSLFGSSEGLTLLHDGGRTPSSVGGVTALAASFQPTLESLKTGAGMTKSVCAKSQPLYVAHKPDWSGLMDGQPLIMSLVLDLEPLQIIMLGALPPERYMGWVEVSSWAFLVTGVFCFLLALWAGALPFYMQYLTMQKEQEDTAELENQKPFVRLAGYLFFFIALALFTFGLIVYDVYTDQHVRAVDDLCSMATTNINMPFEDALSSTITLSTQAKAAYLQTAFTTNLSSLQPTMQALLKQHSQFGAESVQFGSTSGAMIMVRSVAGATGGMCVWERSNDTSCVVSRGLNGGPCDAPVNYTAQDCFYDPRQSEWYRPSRTEPRTWNYGEKWLPVSSSYTLYSQANGMSASVAAMNGTMLTGVWAADFKLGALVAGLKKLSLIDENEGLRRKSSGGGGEGTGGSAEGNALFYTDREGIILATSTGSESDAPAVARLAPDEQVRQAASQILAAHENSFNNVDVKSNAVLKGGTIVGLGDTKLLGLELGMLNIIAFNRPLLYASYERAVELGCVTLVFSAIFLSIFIMSAVRRPWEKLPHQLDDETETDTSSNERWKEELDHRIGVLVTALEARFAKDVREQHQGEKHSSLLRQARVHEKLLDYGVQLLAEGNAQGNVEFHILIKLLDAPGCRYIRRFYYRFNSVLGGYAPMIYHNTISATLSALLALVFWEPHLDGSMAPITYVSLHLGLLSVYGFDLMASAVLSFCAAMPIHMIGESQYNLWGASKLLMTLIVVPALWFVAMSDLFREAEEAADTNLLGHIIIPLLMVCRSEFMWRSIVSFTIACEAAYNIISMLVCQIIVAAAMCPVLLRGLYQSGDFYTDNQYQTFITSFNSMFIYMVTGANYIESLEEPLTHDLWFIFLAFFVVMLIIGLFFIAAVLIEVFQSAFLDGGMESEARIQKCAASMALFHIWSRHYEWHEGGMTFEVFMDAMMQQGRLWPLVPVNQDFHWLQELHARLTHEVKSFLVPVEAGRPTMSPEIREKARVALLDVCAQLRASHLFNFLLDDRPNQGAVRPALMAYKTEMGSRPSPFEDEINEPAQYDENGEYVSQGSLVDLLRLMKLHKECMLHISMPSP